MICAIGKPGHPVRMYFESKNIFRILEQISDDEVALEVESRERWATISADGASVVVGSQPADFSRDMLRQERNAKLSACDWTILPDSPVSAEMRLQWAAYRQALRDITETQATATVDTVIWPSVPGES